MNRREQLSYGMTVGALVGIALYALERTVAVERRLAIIESQLKGIDARLKLAGLKTPAEEASPLAESLARVAQRVVEELNKQRRAAQPPEELPHDGVEIFVLPTRPNMPPQAQLKTKFGDTIATWSNDEGTWTVEGGSQVTDELAEAITAHARSLGVDI